MPRRVWYFFLLIGLLLSVPMLARGQQETPYVMVLTADAPVAPAMVEYVKRGLRSARDTGSDLVIFQLNTPGGSVDAMNDIVQEIRSSPVPVVVYIAPRGAMAGSAGTVIVLAGHASAMAPETMIGAASPVGSQGEDLGETMEAKLKNALKATVRALAERRGPEAVELAERTIEEAAAASANEALDAGLVDFIAEDIQDLLLQLDGFSVQTSTGEIVLETTGATTTPYNQSLIEQLLAVLTNPAIVFLLITVGVQAILIEISSPGGWAAGFIGVVCLALAAYGLGVLPINWFGVIFLVLAFVLFILDLKAPTHGALTVAGVVSLIVGALVMFNSPGVPTFQRVPLPLIIGASSLTGVIFFFMMTFALRAQRTPIRMGAESLVGRIGIARSDMNPSGIVQLGGEQWTAESEEKEMPLRKGERVEVVAIDGLRLRVRRPKVDSKGN